MKTLINRLLLIVLAAAGFTAASCAKSQHDDSTSEGQHKKTLVAYYSATGTTEKIAGRLANVTGGDLYAIVPEKPYSDADLDWNNKRSRSTLEMHDATARPAIGALPADMADYDVVFIGYPIWWDEAPRVINTFIESCDLSGKTVIPFATSGGSSITNSEKELKVSYPSLNWQEGRLLNFADEEEISSWTDDFGY